MPKQVMAYDLLISCPGDVYRSFFGGLENAVSNFNNLYGRNNDIAVRPMSWKKNTYSQYRKHPQESINRQIVDKADFVVAVFWTRFGTETDKYGSGTEEEMERIFNDGKQVFLFFLEKNIPPEILDTEQFNKLKEFKRRHEKDSYFFTFKNKNDLENGLCRQLELYFSDPDNRAETNPKMALSKPEESAPKWEDSLEIHWLNSPIKISFSFSCYGPLNFLPSPFIWSMALEEIFFTCFSECPFSLAIDGVHIRKKVQSMLMMNIRKLIIQFIRTVPKQNLSYADMETTKSRIRHSVYIAQDEDYEKYIDLPIISNAVEEIITKSLLIGYITEKNDVVDGKTVTHYTVTRKGHQKLEEMKMALSKQQSL